MATRTVPFCLEMLTFGHPESSWRTLGSPLDAGRVTGHSHSAFLLGNAYIWPPRGLREASGGTPATFRDAETLRRHSATQSDARRCLFAWKCLHLGHPEASGRPPGTLYDAK